MLVRNLMEAAYGETDWGSESGAAVFTARLLALSAFHPWD